MNTGLKLLLLKISTAAVLFSAAFLPLPQTAKLCCLGAAYIIAGFSVIKEAFENIFKGDLFDENFLMTLATFAAIFLGEYSEAVAVMLFYEIGEFFEAYAVGKSEKSISALMNIRPDFARVQKNGVWHKVSPEEVEKDSLIEVRPGERIPLDGKITEGESFVDTSSLTGESLPRQVKKDDTVLSGVINLGGVLKIKTSGTYPESTVAKILYLTENSSEKKAETENFITRFARVYTPAVVLAAVLLAVLPPLVCGEPWHKWIYRATTFLVISCPCALVISVPLSFFGGLGAASKCGILIKGGNHLEALARTETIVFDKTGTLTKGVFKVTKVAPEGISAAKLLELAAHMEAYSPHPIAASIRNACGRKADASRISEITDCCGKGVCGKFDGAEAVVGSADLLKEKGVAVPPVKSAGTVVYAAADGKYLGFLQIEDEIREEAAGSLAKLKKLGVKQTVMLTGDNDKAARKVAEELHTDKYYAGLLPAGKVVKLEELLKEKSPRATVVFVGDGVNDAPVLARSDIGVAMGGIGSDAAIEAADMVIMTDELSKMTTAVTIAKKAMRLVYQNIFFILTVKAAVLLLGAAGLASIWAAVFADVGVTVISVLNASRALGFGKNGGR